MFKQIVVTTDYNKTDINFDDLLGSPLTKVEFLRRPKELCQDDSLMIDVVKHALSSTSNSCEYVWLLQPTSPFRDFDDFQKIKILIESNMYESVISFKEVKDHPNRCYTLKQEDERYTAHPLRYVNFKNKQELMPIYIRSGNYYVTKKALLFENNTLENKPIYPFEVDRIKGTNIDDEDDLVMAKYYLNYGYAKL